MQAIPLPVKILNSFCPVLNAVAGNIEGKSAVGVKLAGLIARVISSSSKIMTVPRSVESRFANAE